MALLLVLRPEPGAADTAARARAAGHTVVVAPLFTVAPLPWTPPDEAVDALMLTSANAVRHAGPALARYRDLPAYAVGAATASAARAAGFDRVTAGDGDAQALVAAIGAGGRVLHLAGETHRDALPPGAIRRIVYTSAPVATLPPPAADALADGALALLHSPRAAALFAALVDTAGLARTKIALAAFSPAVADAAGDGWSGIAVAHLPTDAALLALADGARG